MNFSFSMDSHPESKLVIFLELKLVEIKNLWVCNVILCDFTKTFSSLCTFHMAKPAFLQMESMKMDNLHGLFECLTYRLDTKEPEFPRRFCCKSPSLCCSLLSWVCLTFQMSIHFDVNNNHMITIIGQLYQKISSFFLKIFTFKEIRCCFIS